MGRGVCQVASRGCWQRADRCPCVPECMFGKLLVLKGVVTCEPATQHIGVNPHSHALEFYLYVSSFMPYAHHRLPLHRHAAAAAA